MTTRRWHLTFPEHLVQVPLVYRLVRDHDLVVNLRRADIDVEFGWIVLEVSGDPERITAGRAFLEEAGVSVADAGGDVLLG